MSKRILTNAQSAVWLNYRRMHARLTTQLGRDLAESGLSEADLDILTMLDESPDESVRALALRCGLEWEKSRLSHQLKRMEERGLVTRFECAADNRGSVVRVTAKGRKLAAQARRVYEQAVRRYVMDALTTEQRQALEGISESVLARLDTPKHKA